MTEMLVGVDGVIVYIDDIVVSGRTKAEHDRRLKQVLAILERNNALLNKSKCIFGVTELEISGFKFIPNLSTRTEPLRKFIRGDVGLFGEDQKRAFDDLRLELSNNVRKLGFFDPNDTT
ncbi:uncharacterized protein LOC129719855 [Wyeomyia smithii]|uniref:uncharacterized protein LOC129719855 n=1 Tax=Wyeomyia smithii TaxID=174621 RepID=UPI002467EE11|nr:uncharacterized protein LOC129719855 [Wyeomyia smithii]